MAGVLIRIESVILYYPFVRLALKATHKVLAVMLATILRIIMVQIFSVKYLNKEILTEMYLHSN